MTNTEAVDKALGEVREHSRCLWQITPNELPKDLPPMSLELWVAGEGKLFLVQLLTEDRRSDWYMRVRSAVRFEQS